MAFPFRVTGSLLTDLTGDGKFESISISDRALVVRDSSDNVIHRSERDVGTELSSLSYEISPSRAFSPVAHASIEPSPVLLNGPENQKRFLTFPRNGRADSAISSVDSEKQGKNPVSKQGLTMISTGTTSTTTTKTHTRWLRALVGFSYPIEFFSQRSAANPIPGLAAA
jgi:hypothetical protein